MFWPFILILSKKIIFINLVTYAKLHKASPDGSKTSMTVI